MPFFRYGGGRGGVKSWRRQALFQGRHCFCPTPTLGGGGGPVKEAGTHSPPCPQWQKISSTNFCSTETTLEQIPNPSPCGLMPKWLLLQLS